jgi:hypothetical protein
MNHTIVKMQFGSHVYGTNIPSSDLDYKAVVLPSPRDIILQRAKQTVVENTKINSSARNTADDIDFETFSLQQYLKLLCEGQTIAFDMLFTPDKFYLQEPDPIWRVIQANKDQFLSKRIQAFVGYCRQQANKYGIRGSRIAAFRAAAELIDRLGNQYGRASKLSKGWIEIEAFVMQHEYCDIVEEKVVTKDNQHSYLLTVCGKSVQQNLSFEKAYEVFQRSVQAYGERALQAEQNEGVDWKALMHAVRVGDEAIEFREKGFITFPRENANLLLQIRQGKLHYKAVAEIIENQLLQLESMEVNTSIRDEPNTLFADDLVFDVYSSLIR